MKLYFYVLKNGKIRVEEKEVEEKPKTYRAKYGENTYEMYKKENEWIVKSGYFYSEIFAHEYDLEKAKELFKEDLKIRIKSSKNRIENENKKIAELEEAIRKLEYAGGETC